MKDLSQNFSRTVSNIFGGGTDFSEREIRDLPLSAHVVGEHAQGGALRRSPWEPKGTAEGRPPGRVLMLGVPLREISSCDHIYLKTSVERSMKELFKDSFQYIWRWDRFF